MWPSQNIHRLDDYSDQDQFSYDQQTGHHVQHNFLAASANANQAWTNDLSASLGNPFFADPNGFTNFSPTGVAFGLQYPVFPSVFPSTSPFQFNADCPQQAGLDNLGRMSSPVTTTGTANSRPPTQLELNARAAELKEKLLKNRTQRDRLSASPVVDRAKDGQPSTAAQGTVNGKLPPVRNKTTFQPPASTLQPAKAPAKPPVQPNEADILELISSHMDSAETARASNKDSRQLKSDAKVVQTTPSQGIPGLGNREQKTDGKKAEPEPTAQPTKTAVGIENEPKEAMSPPEEGEIVAGSPENLETRPESRKHVPIVVPVLKGRPTNLHATFVAGPRSINTASSYTMTKAPQNARGAGTAPAAQIRAESMLKGKDGPRTEHRMEEQTRRPNTSTSSFAKPPLDVQGKLKTWSTTQNSFSRGESVDRGRTVEEDLARLLERDKDLRDWLILTGYHNFEVRTKRLNELRTKQLDRQRKAMELEAEIKRMEAEKKKLEQEDVEMLFMQQPAGQDREKNNRAGLPAKREFEEDADDKANMRLIKAPRISDALGRPESRNGRQDEDARGGPRAHEHGARRDSGPLALVRHDSRPGTPRFYDRPPPLNRSRSPHRAHSAAPRHNEVVRYTNPYGNYRDRDRVYDRGYENHRDNSPFRASSRDRYGGPSPPLALAAQRSQEQAKDIDLGGPGETRFFIVKSFNEDNVRKCMDDGVWATQVQNGQILTAAFATCKNVILFFSINKSRAFQGYARMITAPSPDTPKPRWMKGIHWETSPPFRIEWLSKVEVEFRRIGHLKNSLNENQAVLVGKDGQEVEDQCGRDLLHEMHRIAEEHQRYYRPRGRSPAHRGRGGFAGRGGTKYFIKREP